jgi:ATP-binding cassette subfamily F protein 3
MPSTEIMQDVLRHFDGTVLFITHDRRLIESVATDVWSVEGGAVHRIAGGWESYVKWRDKRRSEASPARQGKGISRSEHEEQRRRANLIQNLRRRHGRIETEIAETEQRLAAINEELSTASAAGDIPLIERLGREYEEKQARLKALWAEWEKVGEQLEKSQDGK